MLQFIIDGYNLVHKINQIKESTVPCHDLIVFIHRNKLTGSLRNQVRIVFDGSKPPYNIADFHYKILFSNEKSADDLIIDIVKKVNNKKQVRVVTDDRQLGYRVGLLGSKVYPINEFIRTKKKIYKREAEKEIKYSDQRQITEELRRIWLDEDAES